VDIEPSAVPDGAHGVLTAAALWLFALRRGVVTALLGAGALGVITALAGLTTGV
jgi:chromate transporter